MGIPERSNPRFFHWTNVIRASAPPTGNPISRSSRGYHGSAVFETRAGRAPHNPHDDLPPPGGNSDVDGERLTSAESLRFLSSPGSGGAGTETTANAISYWLLALDALPLPPSTTPVVATRAYRTRRSRRSSDGLTGISMRRTLTLTERRDQDGRRRQAHSCGLLGHRDTFEVSRPDFDVTRDPTRMSLRGGVRTSAWAPTWLVRVRVIFEELNRDIPDGRRYRRACTMACRPFSTASRHCPNRPGRARLSRPIPADLSNAYSSGQAHCCEEWRGHVKTRRTPWHSSLALTVRRAGRSRRAPQPGCRSATRSRGHAGSGHSCGLWNVRIAKFRFRTVSM